MEDARFLAFSQLPPCSVFGRERKGPIGRLDHGSRRVGHGLLTVSEAWAAPVIPPRTVPRHIKVTFRDDSPDERVTSPSPDRGVWSAARPLGRGPVRVDASRPGRDGNCSYHESAKPNPTCEDPRNRSVVLSPLREASREKVGVPLLDVVVPCLPHLLLEVELVAWDRRRSLPGLARPKENDPSPAPMQLGEASRSGFVFR